MEARRARGNRDNPRLPALSLGLSSVRLIVNKIESEHARAFADADAGDTENRELVKYDPNIDEGYDDDYYDSPLDSTRGRVLSRFIINLGIALSKCIPSVTFWNFGVVALATAFFAPRMISYLLLYPFCRLVFGTLYPAYASYKAVRTKNLKEYVKWMMYWIVFALFTCTETFTDVFLSWFPFYYEVKIVLVLWLLSPATKGSSFLYRKFVHPALCRREQEIDEYIAKAKDQGYHTVLNLGTKGVNYATTVIMQTAIKGGGGLVQQLRKSYSLSDLSECDPRDERAGDEADDVLTEQRVIRRTPKGGYNTRRSASESGSRSMYFPEVDVDVRGTRNARGDEPDLSHIKSSEDISSGYSSADNSSSLTRTASLGAAARAKRPARTTVTPIKRPQAAEEGEVVIEELYEEDSFDYANMPPLVPTSPLYLSHSDPPFLYQYVGEEIKIVRVLGDFPRNFLSTQANEAEKLDFVDSDSKDNKQTNSVTQSELSSQIKETESLKKNTVIDNLNVCKNNLEEVTAKDDTKIDSEPKDELTDANVQKSDEVFVEKASVSGDAIKAKDLTESIDSSKEEQVESKNKIEEKGRESEEKFYVADTEVLELAAEKKTLSANEEQQKYPKIETDSSSDDRKDCASLDTVNDNSSLNEIDTAESDDEASFGTPENSPKTKRKSPKGRYGKGKAPPPPPQKIERVETPTNEDVNPMLEVQPSKSLSTSGESLVDIVNSLPNTSIKETGTFKGLHAINPIAEKKKRHKSRSPATVHKGSSSGIGKLLQIPVKLAFWNKNDDKSKDNISTSSGDHSRRSSEVEKIIDEFQSCSNLNTLAEDTRKESSVKLEKHVSLKETANVDDVIYGQDTQTQDIIEKSNELKKLIEEKLESHSEYKIVSLHEEIPTISKSTDV